MTFEEQLPALVVLGYVATAGLGHFGRKLGSRAKRELEDDRLGNTVTRGRRQLRGATALVTLAWLFGIATTVTWLTVAVGVSGLVTIISLLVLAPAAIIYLTMLLGRLRRRRADGDIDAVWPRLLLGGGALCFLVFAANAVLNGLMYFLGLAYEVGLNVTASYQYNSLASQRTVSGEYLLHGESQVLEHAHWLTLGPVPDAGDTVQVAIAPLWPNPMLVDATNAGVLIAIGLIAAVPGVLLTIITCRERAKAPR